MSTPHDVASSREVLNKTVHDIRASIKALHDAGEDNRLNLDRKVADLTEAIRGVQAAQVATAGADPVGTDRELYYYTERADDVKHAPSINRDNVKSLVHGDRRTLGSRSFVNLGSSNDVVRWIGHTYEDGGYLPGLIDDPNPRTIWQRDLQDLITKRSMVRMIQRVPRTPSLDREIRHHLRMAPPPIRKVFADSAGIGGEWIVDTALPRLQEELHLARKVEALFEVVPIPAGGSVTNPFLSDPGLTPYLASVPTSEPVGQFRSSTLTTAQRTMTAVKLAVRMVVDRDAAEDAIVSFLPVAQRALVEAIIDGKEDCIINGDTAGSPSDDYANWNIRGRWNSAALGGSDDHRRGYIGLRSRAFDVSSTVNQNGAQTGAGFQALRAVLDPPHGLGDVVCVASPEYLLTKMMLFDEVKTFDKIGPAATVVTGQLASLYGVPLVLSSFMSSDLNASGLYDNVTTTQTGMLIFNRSRFVIGQRRGARVEVAPDITRGTDDYVATERSVLHTFDSATKKNVAYGFNLD